MATRKALNPVLGIVSCALGMSLPMHAQSKRNQAQVLVDMTVQKHAEVAALELSATPAGQKNCMTIAATESEDLGQQCDEDEHAALKTMKPFVEHEADGYDVTAPLHDANGKLVGVVGIDFKPGPGQTDAAILKLTASLLQELQQQIPSKEFLFQAASYR